MIKLNYKLIAIFLLLVVLGLLSVLFKDNAQSLALLSSFFKNKDGSNIENTFYIAWGGGAFAHECPSLDCKVVSSFQAQKSLKLPYLNIEDMPDWINVSQFCQKDCFVNKIVFSLSADTALITPYWERRVARIVCDFGSGSGLLTLGEGRQIIITAKHVLQDQKSGNLAKLCKVYLPKEGFVDVGQENFRLHEKYDLAFLNIDFGRENIKILANEPISICQQPAKGEEIVVFGYPSAAQSIDATIDEGVISNINGDYYFTGALIGPGDSGGVAVKKKGNCYLGMPTAVSSVGVENYGVILKGAVLFYDPIRGFSL